ncbi:MAG: WYL domain-containing protein [Verrucomicrobiales bacterium]|nr:WYL domain-containing protein [Verrucomicrobiales bacterium]
MPRADKESTLARQWELLRLLPSRPPGKKARDLMEALEAEGYRVTKRTVERDLAELARVFPIYCNEISRPYGWYWEPGAQPEIPGMDLAEALSLGLLEEVLRPLVPESFVRGLEGRFAQARRKLSSLAGNERAEWSERVRYVPPGLTFLPPTVLPSILREVQEALLHSRQLRVSYLSAGETEPKERNLHPLALLQQGVRTYLVACSLRCEKPLLYALHRIASAEALETPARRPEGFTLDDFLERGGGQFGEGRVITLKAGVSESLSRILEETPMSKDQRIAKGKDGLRLSATVFDSWQLRFWILSQGAEIVVNQPAALRREIMATVEEVGAAYRDDRRSCPG